MNTRTTVTVLLTEMFKNFIEFNLSSCQLFLVFTIHLHHDFFNVYISKSIIVQLLIFSTIIQDFRFVI